MATAAGITLAARELYATTDLKQVLAGDGSTNHILGLKHNIAASAAPGVNDDAGAGYSVGSEWVDTTHAKTYVCVDSSTGAAVWQQMTPSTVTGAALTKTDDTNVTLTLGGSSSTALVNAASITVGWTGTLGVARGGLGVGTLAAHGVVIGNGTSAVNVVAAMGTDTVLTGNGASADPTAKNPATNSNLCAMIQAAYGGI